MSEVLATLYLVSFGFLGGLAAHRMERFTRTLFLQERQLDQERLRSDGLLLNVLPQVVVDQLKVTSGRRIAQAFEQVTVIFVDAVGSTQQAARSSPDAVRPGLGRAVQPVRRDRRPPRTREGQDDRRCLHGRRRRADREWPIMRKPPSRWPSTSSEKRARSDGRRATGLVVHVGVATGTAVAGVIGRRKFAYDLWGDTVNVASRLEEQAEPGEVLVSEATAVRLEGSVRVRAHPDPGPEGQGAARPPGRCVGRKSNVPIEVPST